MRKVEFLGFGGVGRCDIYVLYIQYMDELTCILLRGKPMRDLPPSQHTCLLAPLPPSPPPLLPPSTIKFLLAQFLIHLIMRLAHPSPQRLTTLHARRMAPASLRSIGHPVLEIRRTRPARVELTHEREEGAHVALLACGCRDGICGADAVKEGPGRAA